MYEPNLVKERLGTHIFYRDEGRSPALGVSLWEDCPMLAIRQDPGLAFVYENDFTTYSTGEAGLETDIVDSGGSAAATNAVAGVNGFLSIASDGNADDQIWVNGEDYPIILATGKTLWIETRVKLTEASTSASNIAFGLTDETDLEDLIDASGDDKADTEGAMFHKKQGTLLWAVANSKATTKDTVVTPVLFTSAAWQRIGMKIDYPTIQYYIDGVIAATYSNVLAMPIVPLTFFWGVAASGENAETLLVDWVKVVQLR